MIHYAKDQLFWECESARLSQSGYRDWCIDDDFVKSHGPNNLQSPVPIKVKYHDATTSWQNLVTTYSALEFTKFGDLLPALAGAVQRVTVHRKDNQYMAGMWRDSLLDDLGFYNKDEAKHNNGTPSWSWASLKGAIHFEKILELSHTKLIGLSFDHSGPANISQVIHASIKLESSIISTTVWIEDEGQVCFPTTNEEVEIRVDPIGEWRFSGIKLGSTITVTILFCCNDMGGSIGNAPEETSTGKFKKLRAVSLSTTIGLDTFDKNPEETVWPPEFMEEYVAALPVREVEIE
jgi:hypothetical protein